MSNLAMFCHQCSMAQTGGCGSTGKTQGTCGKDENLSRLQDIMIFGLKGLSAYRTHADDLGAHVDHDGTSRGVAKAASFSLGGGASELDLGTATGLLASAVRTTL